MSVSFSLDKVGLIAIVARLGNPAVRAALGIGTGLSSVSRDWEVSSHVRKGVKA